jgi:hypothetical protein
MVLLWKQEIILLDVFKHHLKLVTGVIHAMNTNLVVRVGGMTSQL